MVVLFLLCVCLECPHPAARSRGETWRWNVLRKRKKANRT